MKKVLKRYRLVYTDGRVVEVSAKNAPEALLFAAAKKPLNGALVSALDIIKAAE